MNYISINRGNTAYLSFAGYFYDKLNYVLLSATNSTMMPYVSAIEYSTTSQKVSAAFPSISGYLYDNYSILGENKLSVTIANLSAGIFDVILGNAAGYTKLSSRNYLLSTN